MTLTAFILNVTLCSATIESINADGTYEVGQYGAVKKNIKGMDKKCWDYQKKNSNVSKNYNMNTIKDTVNVKYFN